MTIAYLVNQYPKLSHSFIRREIEAVERAGVAVQRYALRGWDAPQVEPRDRAEQSRTRYLLRGGVLPLAAALLRRLARDPAGWLRGLLLALRCARRSDRPAPLWLAYFAEACLLAERLRAEGIGHVHAHFGTNAASVAMLAQALGGPGYSVTVHGSEEFDKPEFLHLAEKIRRARFVVAVSSHARSQLYRWTLPGQWHKVHLVRCGVDPAFHAGHDVPVPDVAQLVCVGRLCEQKGHLLLVEAAAVLRRRGRDFRLVLAGEGEMRAAVEARVRAHQLSRHVHITGELTNQAVRELILASRALVLPSFAEGLPVVLMEALALQRPVVASAITGIPELVVPGRNGWLVTPGCVDSLVAALEQVLDADPQRLREMGRLGRADALRAHDVDREAARLAALLVQPPAPHPATPVPLQA